MGFEPAFRRDQKRHTSIALTSLVSTLKFENIKILLAIFKVYSRSWGNSVSTGSDYRPYVWGSILGRGKRFFM
jgi:hypothetical protein